MKHDCLDILQKIGLSWPKTLDCSRFVPDSTKMCMNPPAAPINLASNVIQYGFLNMNTWVIDYFCRGAEAQSEAEDFQPGCPEDTIDLNPLDRRGKCAFRCDRTTMFTKVIDCQICYSFLDLVSVYEVKDFMTRMSAEFMIFENIMNYSFWRKFEL